MRTFLTATIAALILVAASYVIGSTDDAPVEGPSLLPAPVSVDRIGELNRLIGVFEERVDETDDALNQWILGAHYLDRASISGDVADYQAAKDILETAYTTNAGNPAVDVRLASARLGLHDFSGAIDVLEPHLLDLSALAIYGDATLGYGDVELAQDAYMRLERIAPNDPAVTVRLASLEWELGKRAKAIDLANAASTQAAEAGFSGRGLAFYLTYRGQLLFESGRFDEALPVLLEAVSQDGDYLASKIELAHVLAATGDVAGGAKLLTEVLAEGPDADAAVVLGDFRTLLGDFEGAAEAYAMLDVAAAEAPAAYRRDVSRFLSNQDDDVERALSLAEQDLAVRHDSGAFDTLAWALYRNDRFDEARRASDLAMNAGTSDANAFFHAGLISVALGETARGLQEVATALDMNPFFNALLVAEALELVSVAG